MVFFVYFARSIGPGENENESEMKNYLNATDAMRWRVRKKGEKIGKVGGRAVENYANPSFDLRRCAFVAGTWPSVWAGKGLSSGRGLCVFAEGRELNNRSKYLHSTSVSWWCIPLPWLFSIVFEIQKKTGDNFHRFGRLRVWRIKLFKLNKSLYE